MPTIEDQELGERCVRPPLREFFTLFLPVAAVLLAVTYLYTNLRTEERLKESIQQVRAHLNLLSGFVGGELLGTVGLLRELVDDDVVLAATRIPRGGSLGELQQTLLKIGERHPEYQQIRWIDVHGMERVRITRHQDAVGVVSESALQDKRQRYYFQASKSLLPGEFYLSPIDFNVEQGQIELPPRIMVRVATPVIDSTGGRHGILIINIQVRYMLKAIAAIQRVNHDSSYLLVNQDGHLLTAGESNWRTEPPSASDRDFTEAHAEVWRAVGESDSNYLEANDGLWVWVSLSADDVAAASVQTLREVSINPGGDRANSRLLVMLAHRPVSALVGLRSQVRAPIILGALVVLGLYGVSLHYFLRSLMSKRCAEISAAKALAQAQNVKRLLELEERWHRLVEASSIGQLVVDGDGRIALSNAAAQRMLGFDKSELEGLAVEQLLPDQLRAAHATQRNQYFSNPVARKMGSGRKLTAMTKNGSQLPLEIGLNPYIDNGRQFVLVSLIDLSDR